MALRRIARTRFEAGECFVGWAVVRVDPSFWAQAMVALVSVMPVAGVILAAEIARTRLLVLSDRRLWVIDPRARGPLTRSSLADSEHPLAGLTVELVGSARNAEDQEHFRAHPFRALLRPRGAPPMTVRFVTSVGEASRRLPEALRLLASPPGRPAGYAGDGAEPSTDRRPDPL